MTEVLLGEIARPPTNELLACRESYSLAAGLALGMIVLGRGSDAAGLADLHLEDKLGNYMYGKEVVPVYPASSTRSANRAQSVPSSRCCRIHEGPLVNVDVTAAGATLALALIFFQSNNASIAAQESATARALLRDLSSVRMLTHRGWLMLTVLLPLLRAAVLCAGLHLLAPLCPSRPDHASRDCA